MAIIDGWLPPSRENWEFIAYWWQFFPLLALPQFFSSVAPSMGKTSTESRFNIPGKWAWLTMEIPGMTTLLYIMFTVPYQVGLTPRELPWANWTMAGCFVIHYIYRAILAPLFMNPSMSPIHVSVWASAFMWQLCNATSIGGWLAGYGPTTEYNWAGHLYFIEVGLVIWGWGLLANMYHDDDLREIRRAALRRQEKEAKERGMPAEGVTKVYMIPKNGLFNYVLYAHYFCEWIEWAGFWMVGGWNCVPARSFLLNEISAMLPRAIDGKKWYIEKFGADKVGNRKAVIPGII